MSVAASRLSRRHLTVWTVAVMVGPLAAYLVWALSGRHWGHAVFATIANAAFWASGLALWGLTLARVVG